MPNSYDNCVCSYVPLQTVQHPKGCRSAELERDLGLLQPQAAPHGGQWGWCQETESRRRRWWVLSGWMGQSTLTALAEPPCSYLEMLGLERILTWHRMLGSCSGTRTRI